MKRTLLRLIETKLDVLRLLLEDVLGRVELMSAELDRLKVQVERHASVTQSVVTLITGLAEQIRLLKDEPAELAKLADELDAQVGQLAQVVEANTPRPPAQPGP